MDRLAAVATPDVGGWAGRETVGLPPPKPERRANAYLLIGLLALLTGVYLALLATNTAGALRGNAQWRIPSAPHPDSPWWWLPLLPGVTIALLPLARWPRWLTIGLAGVATCLFGYALYAAQWGGGDNLLAKILNGSNGFWAAASQITDVRTTLARYPAFLGTFQASSHVPSHPPGDVLFFRWLNDWMASSPGAQNAVIAAGRPFISGIPMLLNGGGKPYLLAGAIAAIPIVIVLGRLAAIPVGLVASQLEAPVVSASLLLLSLPVLLVFIPLLDTVYPLLTALVVLAGIAAVERRSWPLAVLAGVLFGFSLFYTLGVGAIALPLAIYALLRLRWRSLLIGAAVAAGWAASWLALWLLARINMLAIVQSLLVHQQQWEQQYSYWLWFRWKWYDFAMFGGIPLAALTLKFLFESANRWRQRAPRKIDLFFAGWLAMMIYLWVTPSALAEAGRLWAPLLCFAVLFAAYALPRARWALPAVLVLQLSQAMVLNRFLEIVNPG